MKVNIKPLSVNQAFQGKRFKTPKYKSYEKELLLKLKPLELPEPPYKVVYVFGLSSKLADWDNPIKPFQDILQKYYNFDDRHIIEANVIKKLVPKGSEYIEYYIEPMF